MTTTVEEPHVKWTLKSDWLPVFQTVNPADRRCVAIGFLSSYGAVGYFRLHDDDGVDTKREKENRKIPF